MLLIPVVFALLFLLALTLKLLGGAIAWWVIFLLAALFLLPIIIAFIGYHWQKHRRQQSR